MKLPEQEGVDPSPSPRPSARARLERLLGAAGPLAAALPGFTPRPHQLSLAQGVEQALREKRACLAEAGTGTGKTVGYLVPLFRYLDRKGGRAIVSTHTLALQAQLVERDIPALMEALPDLDIRPAVLKGRTNYLCLQDLQAAATGSLEYVGDPYFEQIQRWANETDTGDVAELDFRFFGWSEVAANVDTCRQRECRYYNQCFYYRARQTAEDANLIVVNHALFFADLRLHEIAPGIPHLLPEYDAVVFDEAHHVEEMATRAFGLEWGSQRVPQLLHRLRHVRGIEQERLLAIERMHEHLMTPFFGAPKAEAFIDEALSVDGERAAFDEVQGELCNLLNAVARELVKIGENVESTTDRDRANGLARAASRISTELVQVTRAEDDTSEGAHFFRWYHTRRLRSGQAFSTLVKTPLSIDGLLQKNLLNPTPRSIFVSATLASGDDFAYLKTRLGMTPTTPTEAATQKPPVEVIEGSPFDYEQNCLLYVPRLLHAPTGGYGNAQDSDRYLHADRVAAETLALIHAARGRTFVLFTSHRMLTQIRDRLYGLHEYPVFVQGEQPNGRLVEAFASAGNGVLLGASSFWEGVDVPGPALSCVIIDKLPFATPDSPVQRARETFIRDSGGDPFRELSLPQAQVRLKQGFGRLLRTMSDRGVVAILDSRLETKGYGRKILQCLPPCPRTDNINDVRAFFASDQTPA